MTTCPRIYTVRVHPVSKMVHVMPTETQNAKAQPSSTIIAPQQETIVLTACMRSKDVREDVLPMLLEDDFVKSDHRTLFRAIRAMHEANYPIDEVSLLDYLKSSRKLDAAGGEKAILRMFESDMPLLSWQSAYDGLIDASRRRSLVMAMNRIEAEAYETPTDMKAFVSKIEDEKSGSRQVILSVAKNRSGPTGDIDMLFVPTSTKFYEVGPRKENRDD